MIKLKGSLGCTSCSHAGIIYTADKKGVFTVPFEASHDLIKFHKFTTVIETEKVESNKIINPIKLALNKKNELDTVDEDF